MAQNVKEKIPIGPTLRRLLRIAGGQQVWLAVSLVIVVLEAATNLGFNQGLARFIDTVSQKDAVGFWYWFWFSGAFSVAGIPLSYFRALLINLFSERTMTRLRLMIAQRSAVLPMRSLEERHSGDMLAVINADLQKLKDMTGGLLLDIVSNIVMGLAALGMLIAISWQLTLVSLIMMPVFFMLMSRINQPMAQRSNEVQEAIGKTTSVAQDGLSGLMVTKAFNLEKVMDARYHQANQMALWKGLALARLRAITQSTGFGVAIFPFLITLGFGGYLAITGKLTFGFLMAFINLMNFVANPIASLPTQFARMSEAAGAGKRVFDLLDSEVERTGGESFQVMEDAAAVRVVDVAFHYDAADPVLEGVSFTAPAGQVTAIVGPSGGGKSTVFKLLLGYFPVVKGEVKLFGHDLRDWSLTAARRHIAVVAQDTYLFPVSLAENIALGKPGATQEEIEKAARQANIHDFIASLPQGYQTLAGERGARLSGGQKQRLSLARAIMKDAPILLLDEPTSALDSESEALVQEALDRFMAGRTTIVIAHRLATIRAAQQVLVLAEGRITERGTHDELLARGGRYYDLYHRQFAETGLTA